MKNVLFVSALILTSLYGNAQTKVFKEVSQEVSSQIKAIVQDGNLVGYLLFTELEKASEDMFNYKLTIMDENLNDIGTMNFKNQKLLLQQVSFEQDVLCLAYIKSNFIGKEFKNYRGYKKQVSGAKDSIFTQFVGLDGKIIKTNSIEANVSTVASAEYNYRKSKVVSEGKLKQQLQLKNITGKGFAMFYGDETSNQFVIYDLEGRQTIKKNIKDKGDEFALLTSGPDVYVLIKDRYENSAYGQYFMLAYRTSDSTTLPKYALKDKKGNELRVLAFDNDPATGRPFVSGNIVGDPLEFDNAKEMGKGSFAGVFTINFNGTKKADVTETYSYWNDGSQSTFSKRGLLVDKNSYARQTSSFKDYSGNTYFIGSSVKKKTRWGAIAGAVVTTPLLVGPVFFLAGGTQKSKITDATLLKQNAKGGLTVENDIKSSGSKFYPARTPFFMYDQRTYYTVSNADTKTSYLVFDDNSNITIYNVDQKKVMRTIPHWNGGIETSVYAAKPGHILVAQYNNKERTKRFSIEPL